VILKPNQFSWTNPNDVNFEKVFAAKTDGPESWGQARAGRVRDACKDRVPGVPKRGRRRTAVKQTPGKALRVRVVGPVGHNDGSASFRALKFKEESPWDA
jgi:Tfp pilus assembly protein PilP